MKLKNAARLIMADLVAFQDVLQNKEDRNDLARAIGVLIYEAPTIKSGWVSKTLVDDYGFRSSTFTEEHYHSRQQAGYKIIEAYEKGDLTMEKLEQMIKEFSHVHLVTAEENNRLSPIQNRPETRDLPHPEQYKLAKIELVPDQGTAPTYFYDKYTIEGIEYPNIDLASRAVKLSYDEIRKRCGSKAKKWVQWSKRKEK